MESLSHKGLYMDDLQKLRVMDPELSTQTQSLKDECGQFVTQITEFQKVADGLIALSDEVLYECVWTTLSSSFFILCAPYSSQVSREVDREKMIALGSRNQLKSVTKAREQQQQQLQAIVVEKKVELERLRLQLEALRKVEAEQLEFIEQLIQNQ